MTSLEKVVLSVVRRLAPINPLTLDVISGHADVKQLAGANPKHTLKAILRSTKELRARRQFGKLRACLLLGIALFGDFFLVKAERTGVLLGSAAEDVQFREFLSLLTEETAGAEAPGWALLHDRLTSYFAYQELLDSIGAKAAEMAHSLRAPPRVSIRMALAVTALSFLRDYFGFSIPTDCSKLIDELGSPEEISSVSSLLIALACENHPLDSLDFALPSVHIPTRELRDLMIHGKAVCEQFEIGKLISLFRYTLKRASVRNLTYCVTPPSADFEYHLRLGFIRAQTSAPVARLDVAAKGSDSVVSMWGLARRIAESCGSDFSEVRDSGTDWRRLRVILPLIPGLYEKIKNGVFYEDLLSFEQHARDFLVPLQYMPDSEAGPTQHLKIDTFHGAWRYFQFLSFIDIELLRPFSKTDPGVLLNSLLRVSPHKLTVEMLAELGFSKEQSDEFIELVSADAQNLGYFDMQYRPFLRIAQTMNPRTGKLTEPEIIHLPSLVCTSNVARNVQSANKLRFELNAKKFVEVVAKTLKTRFNNVESNKPIEGTGSARTDVDVVVLEERSLYLFECKHSLAPTGPHEMRDIWEEIETGVAQLRRAVEILREPYRRRSYIAGWFPGTSLRHRDELQIIGCVLCSHRIFSGLHHEGFPIRDFSSLARLCHDGIIGMGGSVSKDEVVLRQYRVIRGEKMGSLDLDDYLSKDSTFFRTFVPFMHPVCRIQNLGPVTIARETYGYGVDLEQWSNHLEAIGCSRQPDRRQKMSADPFQRTSAVDEDK